MAGKLAGRVGVGGMATKIGAARVASRSGARTLIANGAASDVLVELRAGDEVGTLLAPDVEVLLARKRWIAGQLKTKGELVLDAGAVRGVAPRRQEPAPVGVTASRGTFARGEVVLCLDPDGGAVAKGLVNYSSDETTEDPRLRYARHRGAARLRAGA